MRCISLMMLLLVQCCSVFSQTIQRPTWISDNGNGTFTNPLFYDEFSDPDLIRVGDDYYLTGTTMHAMPGLPVLHSKDLVNWTFLTYAANKLDFSPAYRLQNDRDIYGQGIWAPCFRYHKGVFYIFTNVNGQTTQLFTATDAIGFSYGVSWNTVRRNLFNWKHE
ncbi:MAG: family 43 glycosylhydrolase, partial [Lacibacter sp.]